MNERGRLKRRCSARLGKRLLTGASLLASPRITIGWARPLIRIMGGRPHRLSHISQARRVLVIRPDGIGDVVMTSPLLRELKRGLPSASISLVVGPHAFNLVAECPYVDRVITYRFSRRDRWWRPLAERLKAFRFAHRHLWPQSYDLAIMPRWAHDLYDASVLTYFSGAEWRVGYSEDVEDEKRMRNEGYDRFYTRLVDDRSIRHEVERNLDTLSAIGLHPVDDGIGLWLSADDERFAAAALASLSDRPLFAIGPGAGSKKRLWPIDRFVRLAEYLVGDRGAGIVVLGGAGEENLARVLKETPFGASVIDLVNQATLRQAGAVLRHCNLFCGNDSGTMHLAAAAGIPVVEISCHPVTGDPLHSNAPERFGPWRVPHEVVRPQAVDDGCRRWCRSDRPHCVENVPLEAVMEAIETLMDSKSAPSRGFSYE